MAENYDETLSKLNEVAQSLLERMKDVKRDFVAAAAEFVKNWYWMETESTVTRYPERASAAGIVKLRDLKENVKALQSNAVNVMSKSLDNDDLWYHCSPKDAQRSFRGTHPNRGMDDAIRFVLAELAPVLREANVLNDDELDRWQERDQTGQLCVSGRRRYPYHLDYPPSMTSLVGKYTDLIRDHEALLCKIASTEAAKVKSEALRLWDSA